ncbi:MAG: hypothetical protein HYV13_03420 [Candidatus Doudnabacteria bacterium]|nr:hypothetical protein [Candidatus Doudnabacteria bacterium]
MSKKPEITKYILAGLAVAGVIAVAVVAPNLFAAFGKSSYKSYRGKRFSNEQLAKALRRMKRRKLVGIIREGDKDVIVMTEGGKQKLLKYKLDDMKIKRPPKWDRKFRLVIFDIPEKHKVARNAFVFKMREMGFIKLQKSVWVCPYDCEDEIEYLKEIYEIRPFVKLVLAEKIDSEDSLRKMFSL